MASYKENQLSLNIKALKLLEAKLPLAAILFAVCIVLNSEHKFLCSLLVVVYIGLNVILSKIFGRFIGHPRYLYFETLKFAIHCVYVLGVSIFFEKQSLFWLMHFIYLFRLPLVFSKQAQYMAAILVMALASSFVASFSSSRWTDALFPGALVFGIGWLFQAIVDFLKKIISEREQNLLTIEEQQLQIVQTSKFAALGEMAGGIAHEINNPIGVIALRANQAKRLLETEKCHDPRITEFLQTIEDTVVRIEKIVNGLQRFSRSGNVENMTDTSVRAVIKSTMDLCEERFKNHNIKLIVDDIPSSVRVECREVQISQVLLNLLSNARFVVRELEGERWVKVKFTEYPDEVAIAVSDSGPGIPKDIQSQIMNPFFTTKQIGEGTGIGLSISKGIAEDHSGSLYLDTSQQHTTFVLKIAKKHSKERSPNHEGGYNNQDSPNSYPHSRETG